MISCVLESEVFTSNSQIETVGGPEQRGEGWVIELLATHGCVGGGAGGGFHPAL